MSGEEPPERLSRWDRLSTGLKMWIILSIGLLPLGIVAIIASIDNARASRDKADVEARALLAEHVQRFALALSRNAVVIRTARDAIVESRDPAGICRRTLARLARPPNTPGRFALYGRGPAPVCVTEGCASPRAPPARGGVGAEIVPGGERLKVFLYDPGGAVEGAAEYRRDVLARVVDRPARNGNFAVDLVQGDRIMPLRPMRAGGAGGREVVAEAPFAGNQ